MSTTLKGSPELKARLKALKLAFKPIGRAWADETVKAARPKVPVRTGRLRGSIRRRSATQKRAVVEAHYTANFIDADVKAHDIVPKKKKQLIFQGSGGRTIFSRKVHHRGSKGNRFKRRAAHEGLRKAPPLSTLVDQWNDAA